MIYKWSTRKHWKSWLKRDFKKIYYSLFYNFKLGGMGNTMIPSTGKGKFVSVYSKGSIIQIKHEKGYEHLKYDEIRIIPYKENHGVMVERFKNGKMFGRCHLDLNQFNKDVIFASNIEQLTDKDIDKKIYGYIIEYAAKDPKDKNNSDLQWVNHHNHKIYKKKEIAQNIINNEKWDNFEYRIVPLYK